MVMSETGFFPASAVAGFGESVYRLAEFGPGDVAQRSHQRGILDPAEHLLRFVCQLDPVMPVSDDVLHMVKQLDQARRLCIFTREFRDITRPLSGNPELMQGFFSDRALIDL